MTPEREEKLIEDVSWMKGKLEMYFANVVPTLATCESVVAVNEKVDRHVDGHVSNKNILIGWAGIVVAAASTVFAFLKIGGQ